MTRGHDAAGIAEYLDCSYAAVLHLVMRDGLLASRVGAGDGWRVRRTDLEKWIAEKQVLAAGSGPKARKQQAAPKKPGRASGGPRNERRRRTT